ncbi:MAG: CHASE2 domain-containing protein [Elainellaceae cyanobacterium]
MFQLRIQAIQQDCLFELTWGTGQRLAATVPYPSVLDTHYQTWQQAYLSFYSQTQPLPSPSQNSPFRGRSAGSGSFAPPTIDWQAQLIEAETRLLYTFHRWLRSPELYDIQSTLAGASRQSASDDAAIDIFLTATPTSLLRLPWEAWEVGGMGGHLRIARCPAIVRSPSANCSKPRSRPRILTILGYDPGHTFEADWHQVQKSLRHLAEIPPPIGYHPDLTIPQLKQQIADAIADPQGWDMLIFAGHSNDTDLTGGELGIAPGVSIQIKEIQSQLAIARQNGLQCAVFNSCNGVSIADTLINLGVSQVVVMREPIHAQVAQAFLIQFLNELSHQQDLHQALIHTCDYFKTDVNLTYPSAYLIPSIFRYPNASVFQLHRQTWRDRLRLLRPTRYELAILPTMLLLSWLVPVQDELLDQRILMQARYRQWTGRIEPEPQPQLLLVQIDDESIQRADIIEPKPMSRQYLADLVTQLSNSGTQTIAIDYLLDRAHEEQSALIQATQSAAEQGSCLIFGAFPSQTGGWLQAPPELANPDYSIHGNATRAWGPSHRMPLMVGKPDIYLFAFTLSTFDALDGDRPCIQSTLTDEAQTIYPRLKWQPISQFAYGTLGGQYWLHPITDFSIPPQQVYEPIPAWQVIERSQTLDLSDWQTVMIASGGYEEAGLQPGEDSFKAPLAMQYWYRQDGNPHRLMTGGEHHAYLFHQIRTQRFVVPIPDTWMVVVAFLISKSLTLFLRQARSPKRYFYLLLWAGLAGGAIAYSLFSLELYLASVALLLPIVFPVITIFLMIGSHVHRNQLHQSKSRSES